MKFKLEKASDWDFKEEIEIKTLDDLECLYKKYKEELIVDFKEKIITIYDSYIE